MKRRVLFISTRNSVRSQMAEAFLRQMADEDFEVHSAGTQPHQLHPMTASTMDELGIDISGQRAKSINDLPQVRFDFVITVCDRAREECPKVPGLTDNIHWGFDDPSEDAGSPEEQAKAFRKIAIEIQQRVRLFALVQQRTKTQRSTEPIAA